VEFTKFLYEYTEKKRRCSRGKGMFHVIHNQTQGKPGSYCQHARGHSVT